MKIGTLFCALLCCCLLGAHEGHRAMGWETLSEVPGGLMHYGPLRWLGQWHFTLVHFPIALLFMSVAAEILFIWKPRVMYDNAVRFMLAAAAFLVVPTALFGLALGYSLSESYVGYSAILYPWHCLFGWVTFVLIIGTAWLRNRERYSRVFYFVLLAVTFMAVAMTSETGNALSFGAFTF